MSESSITAPASKRAKQPRPRTLDGYTLIELLVTIALIGILLSLLVPSVTDLLQRQKLQRATTDLVILANAIDRFTGANGALPDDLTEIDIPTIKDPWGRDYEYLPNTVKGYFGKARKDRFLKPLNSDFDLYSFGPDGESRTPLQNPKSHDDIIRAANGAYYGVALKF